MNEWQTFDAPTGEVTVPKRADFNFIDRSDGSAPDGVSPETWDEVKQAAANPDNTAEIDSGRIDQEIERLKNEARIAGSKYPANASPIDTPPDPGMIARAESELQYRESDTVIRTGVISEAFRHLRQIAETEAVEGPYHNTRMHDPNDTDTFVDLYSTSGDDYARSFGSLVARLDGVRQIATIPMLPDGTINEAALASMDPEALRLIADSIADILAANGIDLKNRPAPPSLEAHESSSPDRNDETPQKNSVHYNAQDPRQDSVKPVTPTESPRPTIRDRIQRFREGARNVEARIDRALYKAVGIEHPSVPEQPEPPLEERRSAYSRPLSRRQAEFASNIQQAEFALSEGIGRWSISDSALDSGEHSFASWFRPVTPEDQSLKEYIETTLEPLEHRTGLELGGTGSNLFSGFTEGFFDKTVGISLTDLRRDHPDYENIVTRDAARNHNVILGNMLDPTTKQEIARELGQASFIGLRMADGIHGLPPHPLLISKEAAFWYKLQPEGGLMLAQVPPALTQYMEGWASMIEDQHPNLDVQVGKLLINGLHEMCVMRLHKLPGAPPTLPLLGAHDVMRRH